MCCVLWCRYVWCLWCVCVLCVCGVVCVARLGTRETPVCRFNKSPCVGSKRIRVYRQNARMLNTCARFAGIHGCVFEPAHGDVLSIHTGRREGGSGGGGGGMGEGGGGEGLSSLSCSLLFSLSPLSPCTHTALTCQRVSVPVLWLIPCLAELVRIKKLCKPRATWNEVGRPVLEMSDVSVFVCVCLCLFVFVCVCLCLVVFVCVCLCLSV